MLPPLKTSTTKALRVGALDVPSLRPPGYLPDIIAAERNLEAQRGPYRSGDHRLSSAHTCRFRTVPVPGQLCESVP